LADDNNAEGNVGESGDTATTVLMVADDGTEVVIDRVDARRPDLGLVDFLARMQLTARRHGRRLGVRNVPRELEDLLELVGLADVLGVEGRRKPELREQLGIEEMPQPGDPAA
jgi:hypothetical protein